MAKKNTSSSPPNKSCFDWERLRANYFQRRLDEGATPEEVAAEQIPPDQVVWSPGQLAKSKGNAYTPRTRERSGPEKGVQRKTLTDHEVKQILALNEMGWGNAAIAREVGCTNTTVKAQLLKHNREPVDGRSVRYNNE